MTDSAIEAAAGDITVSVTVIMKVVADDELFCMGRYAMDLRRSW